MLGPLADWTATDENVALLVDAARNDLQYRWTQWTAPESDRQRRQSKRPPPSPPLLPYAIRPQAVTDALHQLEQHQPAGNDRAGLTEMPIEALARLI